MKTFPAPVLFGSAWILLASAPAWAQTVQWYSPSANGNGCDRNDTTILIAGEDISWTFSNMGGDLTAGFAPDTLNKFCRIKAGARVDHGYYLATLQQNLTYGIEKAKYGVQGKIGTTSTFFGHPVSPFNLAFPNGTAYSTPTDTVVRNNNFIVNQPPYYHCSPRHSLNGIFSSTVAVNGRVITPLVSGASMSINAQAFDLKFYARLGWKPCP